MALIMNFNTGIKLLPDTKSSVPLSPKLRSKCKLNGENDVTIYYYTRTVAIPFLDDINP